MVRGDSGNLGDMMGFNIADWILGADAYTWLGMRQKESLSEVTVAPVGSLSAALAESPATIVGGGLINGNSRRYGSEVRIGAVRSFFTKALLEREAKQLPAVIGDPGLLLPRISPITPSETRKPLGFTIHDVDREEFARLDPDRVEHRRQLRTSRRVGRPAVALSGDRLDQSPRLHLCSRLRGAGGALRPQGVRGRGAPRSARRTTSCARCWSALSLRPAKLPI